MKPIFLFVLCITSCIYAANITPDSYWYEAGPNGYNDAGNYRLNDDYYPRPYSTDVDPWVGTTGNYLTAIFDFGEEITFEKIDIFAHAGSAGIAIPQSVTVSFSNDGVNFINSQTYSVPITFGPSNGSGSGGGETGTINFLLDGNNPSRTSRYAKVAIYRSLSSWIFIGEVDFQGADIPEPSTLSLFFIISIGLITYRKYKAK